MGDTSGQSFDVAALLVLIPVVCVLVVVGFVFLRRRRLDPDRRKAKGLKIRLDAVRRDLGRPTEYIGGLPDSASAVRQPFELGLAAMARYQWDQAIGFFQEAQKQAGWQQLIPLLNQCGVCCYMQGRLEEALKDFKESARLADQHGDQQGKASAVGNIGVIRREYGEFGTALGHLKEAVAMARSFDDQRVTATHLGNIGGVYHDKGEIGSALASHQDALAISLRIGDRQGVVNGLDNVGNVRRDKGELEGAFEQYAEALETANQNDYKVGAAASLGNIGGIYRDKGETEKALRFHEDALALDREVGHRVAAANELANIGLILASTGTHEQAVAKLAEALSIFLASRVAHGPLQALYGLSVCDDSLGRERMEDLLNQGSTANASTGDVLDRIDQVRRRRPRHRGSGRAPFALSG